MVTETFRDRLLAGGLLIATGVEGLYGRSGAFESVVDALDATITRLGRHHRAEIMRFPPGTSRTLIERSGYMKGFPHFAGTVHCFCGDEKGHRELMRRIDAGEDWNGGQIATDIVLTPAACYPIYPVLATRGPIAAEGIVVDVASYCFRHEPSIEPTRQQMFRMREYVCLGQPATVQSFRAEWLERMTALMGTLCLPAAVEVANDPFFGRSGRLMAESQRQSELKFELTVPINDGAGPTAVTSFNYHLDHFGQLWPLRLPNGSLPHSGCIGFGMDRLALALFRHHGLATDDWPRAVREALWP